MTILTMCAGEREYFSSQRSAEIDIALKRDGTNSENNPERTVKIPFPKAEDARGEGKDRAKGGSGEEFHRYRVRVDPRGVYRSWEIRSLVFERAQKG